MTPHKQHVSVGELLLKAKCDTGRCHDAMVNRVCVWNTSLGFWQKNDNLLTSPTRYLSYTLITKRFTQL